MGCRYFAPRYMRLAGLCMPRKLIEMGSARGRTKFLSSDWSLKPTPRGANGYGTHGRCISLEIR